MRIARYTHDGLTRFGLIAGHTIAPIRGTPFESLQVDGAAVALDQVKLEVPILPQNFYAIGMNYTEHVMERARRSGNPPELPTRPEPAYRSPNALIADGESIVLPPDTDSVQYEGELVAVIGKRCKYVPEAEALQCVLGYTIGNDISERKWQKADRSFWRSKNSDSFKPMGPWIETELDLEALRTQVRVNGRTQIEFATNHMLFGVARFIATITEYITLHPGDVIWMGTEGASTDLHAGDVVEVQISSIGTLRNPIIASSGARS